MAKTKSSEEVGLENANSVIEQRLLRPVDDSRSATGQSSDDRPRPRQITPQEQAIWGPDLDLRKRSSLNRAQFDPALLAPYSGQWVAWSPDSSRIVAHSVDIDALYKLVSDAGEDPIQCPIEGIDDGGGS
jgi:hypothetical protein